MTLPVPQGDVEWLESVQFMVVVVVIIHRIIDTVMVGMMMANRSNIFFVPMFK